MADHTKSGPFVQMSAFCDMVIEDKTGTLSLIRVIDGWLTTAVGPGAPTKMDLVELSLNHVLSLMPGAARGRHTITLEVEEPSGVTNTLRQMDANFASPTAAVNFINNLRLECELEGVYWINVLIGTPDGTTRELLTRNPLTVRYQRHA